MGLSQVQRGTGTAIKGGDGWRTHTLGIRGSAIMGSRGRCLLADMEVSKGGLRVGDRPK